MESLVRQNITAHITDPYTEPVPLVCTSVACPHTSERGRGELRGELNVHGFKPEIALIKNRQDPNALVFFVASAFSLPGVKPGLGGPS